ncbi:MAG: SIS domain-containing protein [Sediminibacterium sp.]|nr:SIS domain-containing protein [Sediminibacterium sp.]
MGKPFSQELKKIELTYKWASSVPIDDIESIKNSLFHKPLFVVGSGGSFSACVLFSLLHQYHGSIANAITPLDFQYSKNAISHQTNVVFISASGKNTDILHAFDLTVKKEPESILSICLKVGSALSKKGANYSIANTIEFNNPAGKDGFLATNSLLAYFTIISRLYNQHADIKSLTLSKDYQSEISKFCKSLHKDFTLKVLYAGWGKPVAADIESKFSEAGLGNVILADYRNFGHGRHNWFDKKPEQSAIVAIITNEEEELANKTLALLPKSIPVLRIQSEYKTSTASIDLLVKSFYLAEEVGKLKNIDPGRPGVPSYGSKLYNLKYSRLFSDSKSILSEKAALAISRKIGNIESTSIQKDHLSLWRQAYENFSKKLAATTFKGIILDYDGTICSSKDRLKGPRERTTKKLNEFLKAGLALGIATGRGKSVRTDLQKIIDKKYWPNVVIGYYNCSQIGVLSEDALPITTDKIKANDLSKIKDFLTDEPTVSPFIKKPELRPSQLTIEIIDKENSGVIKNIIIDYLKNNYTFKIQVLESSHSVDIIPVSTSKVSIVSACREALNDKAGKFNFLCIGDRGKWPGNDYQLLATEFSLSVDQVSADPYTCWNMSSVGNNCVEATEEYFDAIEPVKSFFKIKL